MFVGYMAQGVPRLVRVDTADVADDVIDVDGLLNGEEGGIEAGPYGLRSIISAMIRRY